MSNEFNHTSVLLDECIEMLNINKDGVYVDGTFGGGGHSKEILKKLSNGTLIGIDKDADAIANAKKNIDNKNLTLMQGDFSNISEILANLNIENVDGILLDLGVSSYQLDSQERGFSYRFDSPLDMRMDQTQSLSAKHVVNDYSESELLKILYNYGEESFAKKIVKNIIAQRKLNPIETTFELVDIINKSYNFVGKKSNATKTFQAIRIEVNGELKMLEKALLDMIYLLAPKGRLAVITFHSLEDRIVKQTFKKLSQACICDKSIPVCVCNNKPVVSVLTKKPIEPSGKEIKDNKRSSSAKLRVVEKI